MTTRKEEKGQLPLSDPTDPPPLTTTRHHPSYSELDYGDHRHTLSFVGLHSLPPGTNADRRKHRHHRHRRNGGSTKEDPTGNKPVTPPSARVQFILGSEFTEDENYQNQHESHPVFSEMEELVLEPSGEFEWKETARWVRYEEDVEKGGQRWSKPHVATLSLHSLFELRSLLLNNIVMLDMEAATLDQIADLILDNTLSSGQLPPEARDKVREALLRRHRHLHEAKVREGKDKQGGARGLPIIRSLAEIGRITSGSRSFQDSTAKTNVDVVMATQPAGNQLSLPGVPAIPSAPSELTSYSSFSGLRPNSSASNLEQDVPKGNVHFMRKIPPGAEASNILIGEVDFLEKPLSAFVRLGQAVFLGDLTEVPVPTRFLFVLLGPMGGISKYHEVGRAMATLMSDEVFHDVAYKAKNRGHLLAGVDEFLDAVTVLPPGEWDPSIRIEPPNQVPSQDPRKRAHAPGQPGQPPTEPLDEDKEVAGPVDEELLEEKLREESGLTRTGRLFGGLMNDVRRKAPWYWSDFRDSLSVQCVASWIFLYFACLTPIITFGGLLGKETGGHMAAIESLVSGFVCGLIYGLFSGQPLTILGSTGPVLVFEKIMVGFCESNALGYLEFRLWIGIWISVILIVLVALDASAFVCYITRFTEENFATLIAFIFMYESFVNVLDIRKAFPVNPGFNNTAASLNCFCEVDGEDLSTVPFQQCGPLYNGTLTGAGCGYKPDVFLMSVLLFVGTFLISVLLKDFKNSSFFPANIRSTISDFAVIIAILAMSSTDYAMHLMTPKLEVPSQFKPTRDDRGWLIDPFGKNPAWSALAAVLPALLACILIFMDQQITAVIINRKEHKLKKGCGYHLDLFVLAILILICSFLGIPWFVAATVLSMNHVNSLRMESETAAPGEKPQFLGVREQRVTHVLIFLMIGLSVLLTPVLRLIPMPVLYGVFLYMGFASLKGMQFFDRILIIFMPEKYQPDHMFLRQVPLLRVHLFTLIQLTCLILLWLIKSFQKTRILFPVMLVVMIIVRKLLDYVFTQRELKILDDIMPEASRKKHEEKVKGGEEGTAGPGQPPLGPGKLTMGPSGQNLQIPLPNGNVMKIPLSNVNITEEVNRSGVWKSVNRGGEEEKGKGRKKERKEVATEEERRRLSTMEEEEDPAPPHIKICPSSPSQRSNRSTPV